MNTEEIKYKKSHPLRCLVVDDESFAIEGILNYIQKLDFLEATATCSSALEATNVLKETEIDLMFLDINMPELTGVEFLESLDKAPLTIITTAYSEYALEGFRLNVVDYLLKPIGFQRFFQATQKALEMYRSNHMLKNEGNTASEMYIKQNDSFVKIVWEDILFVESMQNYLKLHFKDKQYVIHQTMASLEEILPKDAFFRIHKSYLVNISHIDMVSGGRVFVGDIELPLSKHRKEELFNSVISQKLINK
ncbi:DNA-binding LytR/AlgR family response regulator [Parabacteroides sp. PF5-5]|uniref:LytR/AlgR family response regulator transcription factor n=1 Tax=unclassified Parabacteroides TaxID=2649774 RepID=UPI002474901C|nr:MULTISPECIES: LytTR family DNA-binding domain-containing protein [unclassified Parabacteroides]MDH6303971.1 DNA-binding LytR/AlgR family response regulator [Parabacteroides sp. PH5-39]MDH6314587.1 DNA-binding LytR/AlgR family response regulator [Parabacteroides sp. PF5-13]MDH6318348.1 DNA-binding LytR/AlgR family response regulator [Parabacteroides sp. PH5-13]MDH6322360.1 DNA-binding LytR/AlgR family response regulator [Parabacteroides sp. PH5-8]MDH6325561.1 DNA-binding LytR/AlgR family res